MKLHDISIPINSQTLNWPGDPEIHIKQSCNHENDGFSLSEIHLHSHAGTHIDAPFHFIPQGAKIDEITLENFFIPAKVVEYTGTDHISSELIESLDLSGVKAVLFKTSNSVWWQKCNEPFHEDFIALDQPAALAIVEKGITLVGIDYFSVDPFESENHEVHKILLRENVLILENVNLNDISPGDYQLICFPLKVESIDAGLVRAVLFSEGSQ